MPDPDGILDFRTRDGIPKHPDASVSGFREVLMPEWRGFGGDRGPASAWMLTTDRMHPSSCCRPSWRGRYPSSGIRLDAASTLDVGRHLTFRPNILNLDLAFRLPSLTLAIAPDAQTFMDAPGFRPRQAGIRTVTDAARITAGIRTVTVAARIPAAASVLDGSCRSSETTLPAPPGPFRGRLRTASGRLTAFF